MLADSHARARRRRTEQKDTLGVTSEDMEEAIRKRDEWDSSRVHSPLQKAADAQLVDTTDLSIEEQVEIVIQKVESVLGKRKDTE